MLALWKNGTQEQRLLVERQRKRIPKMRKRRKRPRLLQRKRKRRKRTKRFRKLLIHTAATSI